MRAALLSILALTAHGQPLPTGKPITGIEFDSSKLILPPVHIHTLMHGSCKGEPDHVYGDSKGPKTIYYACISGQDVCTQAGAHTISVPRALITQYEQVKALQAAERAEREKEAQARQEQRVRDGLSTGDPALDRQLARQRSEAIANEVKAARAEGRRPNLAQFTKSGPTSLPRTKAAASPAVKIAPANRATAVPLPDEKLAGITVGAALKDVIEKLGNPYSRIAGESERLTYRLESGGIARLIFERGVLSRIERAEP